jgi:sugar lactone lactonase YvrE
MENLMSQAVQNVIAARARLGECPVWDVDRQQLFWVDVYNYRVHQFDPATGQDRHFDVGDVVSAIALTDSDQLLIALRDRLALLNTKTGDLVSLYQTEFSHPSDTRFNDGKCDSEGRFWIGSCSDIAGQAALYRYDPDGSLHVMETGLTISNGLGWSPDESIFYLTDSAQHKIYAYEFERKTGVIRDRRVLIDLTHEAVEPDGLAIDQQGNLWSALWDGWSIVCFNAAGEELFRIKLPVQRPTSLTFGGANLTDLYITSASVGLSQKEIQDGFNAGDLFRLSTDSSGMPTQLFFTSSQAQSWVTSAI